MSFFDQVITHSVEQGAMLATMNICRAMGPGMLRARQEMQGGCNLKRCVMHQTYQKAVFWEESARKSVFFLVNSELAHTCEDVGRNLFACYNQFLTFFRGY
jgi:hypothetical protein